MAMTFEEYAQNHLGTAGLSFSAMELVRMGWNARGEYGEQTEELAIACAYCGGADHIADASEMVQGDVQCMGNLYFNDEDSYDNALVITFADRAGLKAALDSKQCRFTVFGGEV